MWMNVMTFCFIVIFYVANLASPQIWKKNPGDRVGVTLHLGIKDSSDSQLLVESLKPSLHVAIKWRKGMWVSEEVSVTP
jgi:hypothetical protein